MAYKKYIKIKGKKYGPYYYESYRDNGKVKSRYIKNRSFSRGVFSKVNSYLIIFLVLLVGLVFLSVYDSGITGRVIAQSGVTYGQNRSVIINVAESHAFGMFDNETKFCNNDGLCYKNTSNGFFEVYDNDTLIRKFGFGITSEQANRTVLDYNWEWEYRTIENRSFINETNDTAYFQEKVWKWIAKTENAEGTWIQTYSFHPADNLKITHYIENNATNLTKAKLWYIFTVNDDDIAVYNNTEYQLSNSYHLSGNLNNIVARIEFPFESFDFSDVLSDWVVTDLYVGDATMFASTQPVLQNQRILAITVAKSEGGSNFPLGANVTVDPTITRESNDTSSIKNNVTTEPYPLSHITLNDSSLVLYMPFDVDNKSDGITYDYSESDNDGTVSEARFNSSGRYSGAYQFGGANRQDHISLPDSDVLLPGNGSFTLGGWFKTGVTYNSATDVHGGRVITIFREVAAASTKLGLGAYGDGTDTLMVVYHNGAFETLLYGGSNFNDSQWHHEAVTYDEVTDQMVLYYDGIEVNSTSAGNISNSGNFVGGARVGTFTLSFNTGQWNGLIDEVMIWNRSLGASEVSDIYTNQSYRFRTPATQIFQVVDIGQDGSLSRLNVTTNSTLVLDTNISLRMYEWNGTHYNDSVDGDLTVNEGIVGWWHLDNRSGFENDTDVMDWSTFGNNGTVANATFNSSGYFGGAYEFDGVNGSVSIADDDSLDYTNNAPKTISLWFNANDTSGTQSIISKWGVNVNTKEWLLYLSSSALILAVNNEGSEVTSSISAGQWYNAIFTLDTSGNSELFVNGVSQGTGSASGFRSAPNQPIRLGQNSPSDNTFAGIIDEVMVWNRTLSSNEITEFYVKGKLKYEAPSAWQNISDGDNQITNFNVETTTSHVLTEFEFISDKNNTFSPILRDDIILESFEIADITPPGVTINFPANTTYNAYDLPLNFNVTLDEDGDTVRYVLLDGGTNITMSTFNNREYNATNNSIADGQYTFRVYANDTSGNLNDTEQVTFSIDATFPGIEFVSPTPANGTTQTERFVTINTSITEGDLNELIFNWNNTNYTIYDDSLVLLMNMDNRSVLGENDTFIVDVSKYGNNGTANGAIVNTTGKYGRGFEFDGVNDYIDLETPDSLNLESNYTLSAWVYRKSSGAVIRKGNLFDTGFSVSQYNLGVDSSGDIDFHIGNGTNSCRVISFSSDLITADTWHHIVITVNDSIGVNSTKEVAQYADGRYFYSDNCDLSGSYLGSNSTVIGVRTLNTLQSPFNGTIDEVIVFNRSLNAEEIQEFYFSNLYKHDVDKWVLYVNQSKNSTGGLDDGTYTFQSFASDSAGNENSTELRSVTIGPDTTPPEVNLLEPPNATTVNNDTIYFQANFSDDTQLVNVTLYVWNTTNDLIGTNSTNLTGTTNTTNLSLLVPREDDYLWNYLSFDSSNNSAFNVSNFTVTFATFPGIEFVSSTPANGTTQTERFVTINTSITEGDLNELIFNWNNTNYTVYNDSLVLLMNMDNRSALGENDTLIVDLSSYGNNGTVVNATFNSTGRYGGAYEFDGVDDFVKVPPSDIKTLNQGTIVMWARSSNDNDNSVFSVGNTTGNNYFELAIGDGVTTTITNELITILTNPSGSTGNRIGYNTTDRNELFDGEWHHIVMVSTGSAYALYLDSNSLPLTIGDGSNNGEFFGDIQGADNTRLGSLNKNSEGESDLLDGTLDEVMLFNRSLSADEIQELYFSNLYKYDTDKWVLYVNQSKNSTDGLDFGTYTFQGFASDGSGNKNSTELRSVTIGPDTTPPEVNLLEPPNATTVNNDTIYFQANFSDNVQLANATLHVWNLTDLIGTNSTNLTGTTNTTNLSLLVPREDNYLWNYLAYDDSSNNAFNVSNFTVTFSVEEGAAGDGGGGVGVSVGGGGGAAAVRAEAPEIELPESLSISVLAGVNATREMEITNLGDKSVILSIEVEGLEDIISIDKDVSLDAFEKKILRFDIKALNRGLLTGKILFKYGTSVWEVPVVINVRSENFLFDVTVALSDLFRVINVGEKLRAQVNLLQVGPKEKVDVVATYVIKDFSGNIYLEEHETFFVLESRDFIREFPTQNLEPGKYVLGLEITYPGAFGTASSQFEVAERGIKTPFLILIVGLLFGIVLIGVVYRILRKRRGFGKH